MTPGRALTALRSLGIGDVLLYKTDADTMHGRFGRTASTYKALPGRHDMFIPRQTELLLEHHPPHAATPAEPPISARGHSPRGADAG